MREFAQRHNVLATKAYLWRSLIVGKVRRPRGWWRADPAAWEMFCSRRPLREISEKFGICISQAARIRRQALAKDSDNVKE